MHTPVFLREVLDVLEIKKNKKYIDCTFGLGGHAYEMARLGGRVMAIDIDKINVEKRKNDALKRNVLLVYGNYENIERIAKENKFDDVAGILFDLGLSMEQIRSNRGFSYKQEDARLDMRLNNDSEVLAEDIVTSYDENALYETFAKGAEDVNSRAIARSIISARRLNPIKTAGSLNKVIEEGLRIKGQRLEKVLKRVYQALFVEVNNEFESLKLGLKGAINCLDDYGVIAVISFHSGHERIVKRFAKENKLMMRVIRKKVNEARSFERSATLRVLRRI